MVQPFIFTRCTPPGRRILTASGPAVHLHSLSAARKASPDRGWSSRSSSLAIRRQEGVSGPRVVQAFIFTRCPLPGRLIQTTSGPGVYPHSLSAARKASPDPRGPAVHLHSLSAARKEYRDPQWSIRSSSVAIRRQEGVPGPRVSSRSFFTRYPPPGRRIGNPSGPSVHLQSLSAARRAVPDRDCSRRSSSLVYPPPGRRIRSRGAKRSS